MALLDVRMVDLSFGGVAEVTWATLTAVIGVYRQIADDHDLEKKQYGFSLLFTEGTGEVRAVEFWYIKNGLSESSLAAFNETWYSLTIQHGFTRLPTTINYYTV